MIKSIVNPSGLSCLEMCILTVMKKLNLEYKLIYGILFNFIYLPRKASVLNRIGLQLSIGHNTIMNMASTIGLNIKFFETTKIEWFKDQLLHFNRNNEYLIINTNTFVCNWTPYYHKKSINHNLIIYGYDKTAIICVDPMFSTKLCRLSFEEVELSYSLSGYYRLEELNKQKIDYKSYYSDTINHLMKYPINDSYNNFIKDIHDLKDINTEYDIFMDSEWQTSLDKKLTRIACSRVLFAEFMEYMGKQLNKKTLKEIGECINKLSYKWLAVKKLFVRWYIMKDITVKVHILNALNNIIREEQEKLIFLYSCI